VVTYRVPISLDALPAKELSLIFAVGGTAVLNYRIYFPHLYSGRCVFERVAGNKGKLNFPQNNDPIKILSDI
jgi:hypothetical protein